MRLILQVQQELSLGEFHHHHLCQDTQGWLWHLFTLLLLLIIHQDSP